MKKLTPLGSLPALFVFLVIVRPLVLLFVALCPSSGTEADKPIEMGKVVVTDAKTHTLFMGADISIKEGKEMYPVRDVSGGSWVINVEGKTTTVSARTAPIEIKVTPLLKLTEVSATVTNLKSERVYSFNNDPSTRLTRTLSQAARSNADYQANVNQANAVSDIASRMVTYARNYSISNPDSLIGEPTKLQDVTHAENENLITQSSGPGSDLSVGGAKILSDGLDAVNLAFDVASGKPLGNPYVVAIFRFRPKEAGPGMVQNLIYAKNLNPIDSNTVHVEFEVDGFPPGFELLSSHMHLYNRGVEVGTTVAPRRVELTREEAFEYVKMEYVSSHRNDTLPPVAAMGLLPADLPRRLALGDYRNTVYVRVSKEGLATEAFSDASCTEKIDDAFLSTVVKSIRFKPALERGRPATGIAMLNLNTFTF